MKIYIEILNENFNWNFLNLIKIFIENSNIEKLTDIEKVSDIEKLPDIGKLPDILKLPEIEKNG